MMQHTTPEQRAEQAGHAEAMATLTAMGHARELHRQGKGPHPSQLLTSLLCQVADHDGPHPEHFIAGVSVALYPWLELATKRTGGGA